MLINTRGTVDAEPPDGFIDNFRLWDRVVPLGTLDGLRVTDSLVPEPATLTTLAAVMVVALRRKR